MHANKELIQFLRDIKEEVLFCPTQGNAGDSLISTAAYQVFNRHQIRYLTIRIDDDVKGRVVVLNGGGNLVPEYKNVRLALDRFASAAKLIVILPHTIRGHEQCLQSLPPHTALFCRDAVSYQHVISHVSTSYVFLAHDMAFMLDPEPLLSDLELVRSARELAEQALARVGRSLRSLEAPHCLFFRTDRESALNSIPKESIDLSALLSFGVRSKKATLASCALLDVISRVNHVLTDRLHVGISACLLDRKLDLFENNYSKCRDVFMHSINRTYDNAALYSVNSRQNISDLIQRLASM